MNDLDRCGQDRQPPDRRAFGGIRLIGISLLGVAIIELAFFGYILPSRGPLNFGPRYAKVTGKISYRGTPLPSGSITFIGPAGSEPGTGLIEDGFYTVMAAPIGDVQVSVATFRPRSRDEVVLIPWKYSNPDTSGLRYKIKKSTTVIDIDLKD